MSAKVKHEKPDKAKKCSEVSSARNKLDDALQTLVEKVEESPPESDDEESKLSPDAFIKDSSSPGVSPSKRSPSKAQRKRRRKDDTNGQDIGHYHHTYVMKLFDRSVDLAQFGDNTPLYPICRAWMRNQPHNRNLAPRTRSPSPEPDNLVGSGDDDMDETKTRNVYWLPQPLNLDHSTKDLRIPSPVPQPEETLDINVVDPELMPTKDILLANHMTRWKRIRQKWKEAAFTHESRFKDSLSTLKNMFESAMKT